MRRTFLFPILVMSVVALNACQSELTLNLVYTPESLTKIDAEIFVNTVNYEKPVTIKANQIVQNNNSLGLELFSAQPVSDFVREALSKELFISGVDVSPTGRCKIDVDIHELSTKLGYDPSYSSELQYTVYRLGTGAQVYKKRVVSKIERPGKTEYQFENDIMKVLSDNFLKFLNDPVFLSTATESCSPKA